MALLQLPGARGRDYPALLPLFDDPARAAGQATTMRQL